MRRRAQIALEFLLLTAFAMILLLGLLVVLGNISKQNSDYKKDMALADLGNSIRNEIVLASEMQNGYQRIFNLPATANGAQYYLTLDEGGSGVSYLVVSSTNYETLYSIPKTTGTIGPGLNLITKINENITIINTP